MSNSFDGLFGRIAAPVMARKNRDAEIEAVQMLAPPDGAKILVIGFGPGLGIAELFQEVARVEVVGIDPSDVMMKEAAKRNASFITDGRLQLVRTTADSIPFQSGTFDGAIAVNAIQLCEPFDISLTEIGRVMKNKAKLVTITHGWAAAKHAGTTENWIANIKSALSSCGFEAIDDFRGKSEGGKAIIVNAVRRVE